jgi:hypothetical protein
MPALGRPPNPETARRSGAYTAAVDLTGRSAGPAAQRAVQFALAQVGKPYVWGAEGPDTYDCSGLVQAAYAAAGVSLPRVARAQFRATAPVPATAMVPGDLLFFGPDRADPETIHHVGIYLGSGQMVHAPTAGDVVRVAPVWWAEFFGAARVVGAVSGAGGGVPFTIPPPAPVIRTVSDPSPPSRHQAQRPGSDAPVSRDPSPGGSDKHPGTGTGAAPPAAGPGATPPAAPPSAEPGRATCPATGPGPDPRAAVTTVTGWVAGLVGRVVGPASSDLPPQSPPCSRGAAAQPGSRTHDPAGTTGSR